MDGYPPDRSWVYDRLYPARGGVKPSFAKGVQEFILKARVQPKVASNGGIRCPCDICKFRSILSEREVKVHLYRVGFKPNYWYWTEHGEEVPHVHPVNVPSSSGLMDNDDPFTLMQHMVDDAFRSRYDLQSMGDVGNEEDEEDIREDEEDIHEEPPNADAQDFYDLLTAANEPIYEGASESKLSICVKLLACKTNWNIPQKCLDFIASMLGDVCPSKEKLPKKNYQAKRLVSMLGLESQKIDCCVNGCMLYYKDDSAERQCKFCQEPRYVPRKTGIGKYNDVPAKRMFYLPITPRLKRLYASTETAAEMRWHSHNRSGSDILRHPSDGEAWKHFDAVYPDFANEPRNSDELGREPMVDEIFLKTHTKKKDKSWVDNRSRETYEAYQEKVQQAASSQPSDGGEATGSVDPSTQLQLWAQSAGGRTRGRLYGVGGLSGRFRHGVSSLTQESHASSASTQSPTQYSTEVAAQIAAFEERTRKAEEEAREAREEAREARRKSEEEAQEAQEARRIASERDQQFQQQLRELSTSAAAIQAQKSRRCHPDYDESEEDD